MRYPKSFLLLVSFALPFMIFIVSGLSFYLGNINEITFNFREIGIPLALIFLTTWLLFFVMFLLIRRYQLLSVLVAGAFTGIALSIWVQSQIFLWRFGPFNGQLIHWGQWKMQMALEGIMWLGITTTCILVFMRKKGKPERMLIVMVYFLGSLSILTAFVKAPQSKAGKVDSSVYRKVFDFHPDKNVLIVLLDDFQSDYFNLIAEKYPQETGDLDGFTFYRNTITRFPTTKASLPSIITGVAYRNKTIYDTYVKESYRKFNMIDAYKSRGYRTSFVGQLQTLFPGVISMEDMAHQMHSDHFNQAFEYVDYAVFRGLPIFLKRVIYNHGNWFFAFLTRKNYPPDYHGGDVRFLELMEDKAAVSSTGKGSFKFLHFFIPHAPWRVNERLEFDPSLSGDSGYIRQTRGAVKLAGRLLQTLKKIGVYDQTEIVIMSDHGSVNMGAISSRNIYDDAVGRVTSVVQGSSLALLLHKPAKSRGKMKTSDVPLELTDLSCLLGLHPGDSACREFDLAFSGEKRKRTYYYYPWMQEDWMSEYLPPMTEYIVSGPSYNIESYSPGGSVYASDGTHKINPPSFPSYKLGNNIRFYQKGNGEADRYLREGWSRPEANFTWTDGPVAGLVFRLEKPPQKNISLRILALGYLAQNKIKGQTVSIVVNRVPIGRLVVNKPQWYEAVIPASLVSGGNINMVFKISNPMSPSDDSKSTDSRQLGIGVANIVLEEMK